MISEPQSIREYVSGLAQNGRYHFTSADAQKALGGSRDAAKLALNRLRRKGEIASPSRGFYVIVPPEYRALGCLPADQFIPALMEHVGLAYYVGLLSAAQYHGAGHHRPQELQVMIGKPRRPLVCGKVRVAFHQRRDVGDVPVQSFNTPRGSIRVSTPEATAYDLVGYESRVGGLDAVATVLAELAEGINPVRLCDVAPLVPLVWVQRLGYLLDRVGASVQAESLKGFVRAHARDFTPLLPSVPHDASPRDEPWKLIVNAEVEAES